MISDNSTPVWKQWLGLGMLALAIVVGGSLLELTADDAEGWYGLPVRGQHASGQRQLAGRLRFSRAG